ncbi:ArsR/SmtB family transcription factor [Fodinibius roseus]|uniref:ArsR/SmtB family transcription factor n=1 Tax=Fodinibius roseus TaxID=1194090 RepID=UPI000932908E|nr:helix-turn-helix domain-containing protein [Fodinibius roseus]
MRKQIHPDIESVELSTVLYALSDPVRLEITKWLAEHPDQTCGDIPVDVADSTKSYHLKILRESGVINMSAEGKNRFVTLRKDDFKKRFPGLLSSILEAI